MSKTVFPIESAQFKDLDEMGVLVIALNETHSMLSSINDQLQNRGDGSRVDREWYTVAEVSQLVGRKEFTVREWCRRGRIEACRSGGRGETGEWRIHRDELDRYRDEGLLS